MKALILASGDGKRLAPMTAAVPRTLVKLADKPVLEYVFELLFANGFDSVDIAVDAENGAAKEIYGNEFGGLRLEWHDAEACDAKSISKIYAGISEPVAVVPVGPLCDFDIRAALAFHSERSSAATVVTKRVADPRDYISIISDENGRITGFAEAPSFSELRSDNAFSGMLILSPEGVAVLARASSGDGEPGLIQSLFHGCTDLFEYRETGYWHDISAIEGYIACQLEMLGGNTRFMLKGHKTLEGNYICDADCRVPALQPPCYIGENAVIAESAKIASSVIGENVYIGEGAKLSGCVVHRGAHIGARVTCRDAVICEGAVLMDSCAVFEGAVVGKNAGIGRGAVVESGVGIWPGKQVASYKTAAFDVKHGRITPIESDELGICGETGTEITVAVASRAGQSLSARGRKIAVAMKGGAACEALEAALVSGILSGGADAWRIGECSEAALAYAMSVSECDYGFFVEADSCARIAAFAENGLGLTHRDENQLDSGLRSADYPKMSFGEYGRIVDFSAARELYFNMLKRRLPRTEASFTASGKYMKKLCAKLNLENTGKGICFQLSADGKRVAAFSEKTGFVSFERLVLLCCDAILSKGQEVALCEDFPFAADKLAALRGGKVLRWSACPPDGSDAGARELAAAQPMFRDGLLLSFAVLSALESSGEDFAEALERLPGFVTAERVVGIKTSADIAAQRLEKQIGKRSDIRIRPSKSGKSIRMCAETASYETAAELCDFCERLIKNDEA